MANDHQARRRASREARSLQQWRLIRPRCRPATSVNAPGGAGHRHREHASIILGVHGTGAPEWRPRFRARVVVLRSVLLDDVEARAAVEDVLAGTADEGVVAVAAEQGVVAVSPDEEVVAGAAV